MSAFSCRRVIVTALALAPLLGCSAASDINLGTATAAGSTAIGGTASGANPAIGGSNSNPQQGGSNSSGGVTSAGGLTSTGVAATTGGMISAGGVPSSTGGARPTGGATNTGGTTSTGGAPSTTGGARPTGGATSTGGTRPTGGATNTGGMTSTGGTTGTAGSTACSSGPLATSIANCVIVPPASTGDYHQDCVNTINKIRWDCMCLPPLARWTEGEACADQMAIYDSGQNSAHAGFMAKLCTPGGTAQCECPGWGSVASITQGTTRSQSCLAMMWHEVDTPSGEQGHYQAMSNKTYTKVACGINTSATSVWALQNYSR